MLAGVPSLSAVESRDKSARVAAAAAPVKDWCVEAVADVANLPIHQNAWDRLAKEVIEPNVFYEPWMFLANVQAFAPTRPICIAFVYRHDPRPKQTPQLCGFFPFERRRWFKGLPIRSLRLLEQPLNWLRTPLVHRDWAPETLNVLFDWIAREERCSLVDWPMIHGEGPFHHALLDVLGERRMGTWVDAVYGRALIRRAADAESYCVGAMNHLSRKEWRRQRRRLAETGQLESRVLQTGDDVHRWIAQFLELEAKGWKSHENTALAQCEASRAYFQTIARNAAARGQLQMLGLFLDDRPIALKCNFLTGNGGFAFKIAFDESCARSSPGVQLELDNIDELHRRSDLHWMDSCAIPGHFMINRLWKERRTIQNLVIASSRFTGNSVVGVLPMLRAIKRMIKPSRA